MSRTPVNSSPPYEFETTFAPSRTAVLTAAPIESNELSSASTSRILQRGHDAETACTSSAISTPQPGSPGGGTLPPRWFSLRKHPFAVVQGRSDQALR